MDTTKSIRCTIGWHRWETAPVDWTGGRTCADCGRHRDGSQRAQSGARSERASRPWGGGVWGFSDGGGFGGGFGGGGFDGGGCGGDGGGGC